MLVNATFEGGGIKGLCYIGALKCLEDYGIKIFKTSGTSVGSIFATLVVAGYTAREMASMIEKIDIDMILKKNSIGMALKGLGVNNIENLQVELDKILQRKGIKTFLDVKHGDDYLLKIIVTHYKTREMLVLPMDFKKINLVPDYQSISDAVAMSCSVPGLYSAYKYKNKYFGDGGLVNNFPVDVLDKNYPVLAFSLNSDNKSVSTSTKLSEGVHIINIDTLGIKSLDFKKGLERRKELYVAGYNSVKYYLESIKRINGKLI